MQNMHDGIVQSLQKKQNIFMLFASPPWFNLSKQIKLVEKLLRSNLQIYLYILVIGAMDEQEQIRFLKQEVNGVGFVLTISLMNKQNAIYFFLKDIQNRANYELFLEEDKYNSRPRRLKTFIEFCQEFFPTETVNPDAVETKHFDQWISYFNDQFSFRVQVGGKIEIKLEWFNRMKKTNEENYETFQLDFLDTFKEEDIQEMSQKEIQVLKNQNQQLKDEVSHLKKKLEEKDRLIQQMKAEKAEILEREVKLKKVYEAQLQKWKTESVFKEGNADENKAPLSDRMVDKKSPFSNQFDIGHNFIEYTGEQQDVHTQILFKLEIPRAGIFNFIVKVAKLNSKNMLIGVVDRGLCIGRRSSYDTGNAVAYSSFIGDRYPLRDIDGGGFQEGEVIKMQVNLDEGVVKYLVGSDNYLKTQIKYEGLKNEGITWVPYIEFQSKGDKVELQPCSWVPE